MEARAVARYVRMSPRKIRLVVDMVRGKDVNEALDVLKFTAKRAAIPVEKTLRSAVANAVNTGEEDIDADDLYIKRALVDQGPTMHRWRARAMGRPGRIRHRTSHITVVVASKEEEKKAAS